jgi:hypothetical protein
LRLDRPKCKQSAQDPCRFGESAADLVVNGHHLADQMTPKSTLFPEGKMNNRDAGLQQGKKLSKKGRLKPAFSTSDEQEERKWWCAPP